MRVVVGLRKVADTLPSEWLVNRGRDKYDIYSFCICDPPEENEG